MLVIQEWVPERTRCLWSGHPAEESNNVNTLKDKQRKVIASVWTSCHEMKFAVLNAVDFETQDDLLSTWVT